MNKVIIYDFTVYMSNACFDTQTPLSALPPPQLFIEEETVFFAENREYFNSPSVYRGSTPKGEGVGLL